MARMEEAKINRLVDEVEKKTMVRFSVEEIEYENEHEKLEFSYSLYFDTDKFKFYVMEEVPGVAVEAYMKGILVGYEHAIEKQFKTICQN